MLSHKSCAKLSFFDQFNSFNSFTSTWLKRIIKQTPNRRYSFHCYCSFAKHNNVWKHISWVCYICVSRDHNHIELVTTIRNCVTNEQRVQRFDSFLLPLFLFINTLYIHHNISFFSCFFAVWIFQFIKTVQKTKSNTSNFVRELYHLDLITETSFLSKLYLFGISPLSFLLSSVLILIFRSLFDLSSHHLFYYILSHYSNLSTSEKIFVNCFYLYVYINWTISTWILKYISTIFRPRKNTTSPFECRTKTEIMLDTFKYFGLCCRTYTLRPPTLKIYTHVWRTAASSREEKRRR